MSIYIGDKEIKDLKIGTTTPTAVYLGDNKVRPKALPNRLCFTAVEASSMVQLTKSGTPAEVELETSIDGATWSDYTIGTEIALINIGDKIYLRNKSETTTGFSTSSANRYSFVMTGKIAASGDINYLLNKNSTDSLPADGCYNNLFRQCDPLISCPSLPATVLKSNCYAQMFSNCLNLEALPQLPATELPSGCYNYMFMGCAKIKISTTGEYPTPYRIPTSGTGTTSGSVARYMFRSTGGTFTGSPTINTTYYTSNEIIG